MDDDVARELLRRICAKDRQAVTDFYNGFKGLTYRYCLHMVRDSARAEDATNDTMYRICKGACDFRGDSTVKTWVYSIAKHVVQEIWRKDKTDPMHNYAELDDESETLPSEEPAHFSGLTDVEATANASDRRRGLEGCMNKLNPAFRECLYLAYFEDWSNAEIAAHQGVSPNRIKGRVFHALRKVRRCVENFLRGEGPRI